MRDAREACAACRRGFVGGWLLGSRESAPLLQSPATGSTRLTGWLFRAVGIERFRMGEFCCGGVVLRKYRRNEYLNVGNLVAFDI